MSVASVSTVSLAALEEDRRSAWVPDVVAGADSFKLVEWGSDRALGSTSTKFDVLQIPKPDGTHFSAPILPLPTLIGLFEALEPVRAVIDDVLDPGVCGYRRGAEADSSYSREYLRFTEMTRAESEGATHIVTADVAKFFAKTSWSTVLASFADVLGADVPPALERWIATASRRGLDVLPAGYADARLLGNVVLASVDKEIAGRFARWVDDYRLFATSEHEAAELVQRLDKGLAAVGLVSNSRKTKMYTQAEFESNRSRPLESVYHPDLETPEQVRSSLRSLFLESASDPVIGRRGLRFSLSRLAREEDDFALDWSLSVLPEIPWEAPRVTAYVARFAHRRFVGGAVERLLVDALAAREDWLSVRLAALACHTGIRSSAAAEAVVAAATSTGSSSLWGLLLRALSVGGWRDETAYVLSRGVLDARAAIAAQIDLSAALPESIEREFPWTVDALRGHAVPLPSVESIL